MLDQNKINQFTARAKAKGFNDAQIAAEIARKKKELETQTKPTTPSPTPTAPTPGMDMTEANTFQQPARPKEVVRDKPKGVMGFLDSAVDFVLPRASRFARKVGATIGLSQNLPEVEKMNKNLQDQAGDYIKRAQSETDPTKKRALLDAAKRLDERASQNIEDTLGGFEKASGISRNDKSLQDNGKRVLGVPTQYVQEGLGVGGEIGSLFVPVGKAAKGASLATKVATGAKMGAKIGAIQGVTNPNVELDDIGGRLKQTLTDAGFGALTGGVFTAAYEIPKSAIKKIASTEAAQKTIRGVFKIAPSEMRKFRKVNGMDFGEEILARDGKKIAGMDVPEIADYMGGRKKAAQKAVSDALTGSTKTIKTSDFLTAIDEKIATLDPKKGNINTEGAIATLKSIKATLKKNPKVLPLEVANTVKSQLQDAGAAAYSPTGKATPTSKAFAEIGSLFKKAIEEQAPSVKQANKLIQLYDLAQKSILAEGDRAANKVASGNLQKFVQNIPVLVGGGIGFGTAGVPGGVAGIIGGEMVSGLQGTIRNKLLSPQVQTAMAARIQQLAKGIENPTAQQIKAITDRVAQETIKQISRSVTSGQPVGTSTQPDQQIQQEQNSQLPTNNQAEQTNQPDHTTSVPQAFGSEQTPFAQPTATATGHTVEQHMRALSKATAAGDKAAIKQIQAQLTIEQNYQKATGTKLSATEKAKVQEAEGGLRLVDVIENNFTELQGMGLTAQTGGLGRLQGLSGEAAAITQSGQKGEAAAAYKDTVEAFLSKLSRASGEKGVLTDQDIARIKKALPKFTDAPGTVERKLENVREILGGAIKAKMATPIGEGEASMEEAVGGFATP